MTHLAASAVLDAASPAARFLVRGLLVLGTRSLFIVRGTVVSGVARAGYRIVGVPGMDAPVFSVESGLLDVNGGAAQTALTFRYANQAQLARWRTQIAEGALLTLGAPPAAQ